MAAPWYMPGIRLPQAIGVSAGGAAPYPANDPNIQLWLDFTDTSGSFVTTSSGKITQVVDRSVNARTWSQGTDAQRPLQTANVRNGRSVLEWVPASSTVLRDLSGTTYITSGQAFTLCGVLQMNVDSDRGLCTLKNNLGGAFPNLLFGLSNVAGFSSMYFGGANMVSRHGTLGSPSSWLYFVLTYNGGTITTTTNWALRVGGAAVTLSNTGSGLGAGTTNKMGDAENGGFASGYLMHFALFNTEKTGAALTELESWLATEMG